MDKVFVKTMRKVMSSKKLLGVILVFVVSTLIVIAFSLHWIPIWQEYLPIATYLDIPGRLKPSITATVSEKEFRSMIPSTTKPVVTIIRGNSGDERSPIVSKVQRTIKCLEKGKPRIEGSLGMRFQGDTLYKTGQHYSMRHIQDWGNVLSPYWAARTMAELGGYKFRVSGTFGAGTWMEYLPQSAPARIPRESIFQVLILPLSLIRTSIIRIFQ